MILSILVLSALHAARGAASEAPSDELLRVDDHRLHFEVRPGTRPVTVVLEAGGAADATSWASVPERISEQTGATVVTYDRAGLGSSELGPLDLVPLQEVDQLSFALGQMAVPEATVMVGHSYGGLLALDYAARHPEHLLGVVLVDPMNPRFIAATGDFVRSTAPEIDSPATNLDHVVVRMTKTLDVLAERVRSSEAGVEAPMVIVTAGEAWWGDDEIDAAWRRSHQEMVAEAPARSLVIAEGSKHDIPTQRPEAIVDAVATILAAARPRHP